MFNFKNFLNSKNQPESKDIPDDKIKEAKTIIEKYSGMSEEELTTKIADAIKEQKANNTYNKQKILSQIESLSFVLTPEQKQKMIKLLEDIDSTN